MTVRGQKRIAQEQEPRKLRSAEEFQTKEPSYADAKHKRYDPEAL